MDSKSTTGQYVVYSTKTVSTAAPKSAVSTSTAQKTSFSSVNGYSSYMSCTTGVPNKTF